MLLLFKTLPYKVYENSVYVFSYQPISYKGVKKLNILCMVTSEP